MCLIKRIDLLHDLYAECIRLFVMAVSSGLAFLFHQIIDALCHADHTEHRGKTVSVDEAFLCEEIVFEKSALLHDKTNARIHVVCHYLAYIRKMILLEILYILRSLRDIAENQTA